MLLTDSHNSLSKLQIHREGNGDTDIEGERERARWERVREREREQDREAEGENEKDGGETQEVRGLKQKALECYQQGQCRCETSE